jgi:hypothetical protein
MRRNVKGFTSRLVFGKYKLDVTRIVLLASAVLIIFLIGLYTSCAYPGFFGLEYAKIPLGREHVNTYKNDVRQLSPESAAALKVSIESLKGFTVNQSGQSGAVAVDHRSDPQHQLRAEPVLNEGSTVEDKVSDLKFVVQMHGFQCLVHTLRARKFEPDGLGDVTWVTQLTTDRLPIFMQMLDRWKGPVSAALYSQVRLASTVLVAVVLDARALRYGESYK